jgi:hypothetical protein
VVGSGSMSRGVGWLAADQTDRRRHPAYAGVVSKM